MSGTSGGAIVAMLLAIGMNSAQMKECLSENIRVKLMGKSVMSECYFRPYPCSVRLHRIRDCLG